MDFTDVKSITIPVNGTNRDVKSISIGGVTVWSKIVALVSISLSGQTTSLNQGDAFSFGGTVTATYSDGSTADVTSSTTFSGYNMSTAGTYTVTASYTENGITATASYQLTVVAVASWHTLWSGNVSINNDAINKDIATISSLSGSVKIRITWSVNMSGGSGMTNYYYANSTTPQTTKPASPYELTFNASSNKTYLIGAKRSNSSPSGRAAHVDWYSSLKRFVLQGSEMAYGTGNVNLTFTVTKIEQYY